MLILACGGRRCGGSLRWPPAQAASHSRRSRNTRNPPKRPGIEAISAENDAGVMLLSPLPLGWSEELRRDRHL
jgi:hypothetical protein